MTDVDHYKAPDGSVYASVKGKSGNVNGAIDNANFVADSYGAYDPVNGEPEKKKVKDLNMTWGLTVTWFMIIQRCFPYQHHRLLLMNVWTLSV